MSPCRSARGRQPCFGGKATTPPTRRLPASLRRPAGVGPASGTACRVRLSVCGEADRSVVQSPCAGAALTRLSPPTLSPCQSGGCGGKKSRCAFLKKKSEKKELHASPLGRPRGNCVRCVCAWLSGWSPASMQNRRVVTCHMLVQPWLHVVTLVYFSLAWT